MSLQYEGITDQHKQAVTLTPRDKGAVLPNDDGSVLPPVAKAGAHGANSCWTGGDAHPTIICINDRDICNAFVNQGGWRAGTPHPRSCTVNWTLP